MSTNQPTHLPARPSEGLDGLALARTVAAFLAGYGEVTRNAYALDLRQWVEWCQSNGLPVFEVRRAHIEFSPDPSRSKDELGRRWRVDCRRSLGSTGIV